MKSATDSDRETASLSDIKSTAKSAQMAPLFASQRGVTDSVDQTLDPLLAERRNTGTELPKTQTEERVALARITGAVEHGAAGGI